MTSLYLSHFQHVTKQFTQQLTGAVETHFHSFFCGGLNPGDFSVTETVPSRKNQDFTHIVWKFADSFLHGSEAFIGCGLLIW